jgi:hypothetical protein
MLSDAFELQIKLDRVVSAGAHGAFFSSGYGHSGQVSVCCRVNRQAINAPLFERLTAQVKRRRVQIGQVRQGKVARRCLGGGAFAFCAYSSHSTVGESEMGSDFLRAVALRLVRFDGSQCLGVRNGALCDIQFPQRPDKANGSAGTFELKPVVRWLGEVNLTGRRGYSGPPEAIGCTQRAQLWKIPSRLFAECCLPIRGKRTGRTGEQDRNRAFRYSKSGSKKHFQEVRNCSQPSPCQRAISSVQKNTREFIPRVF